MTQQELILTVRKKVGAAFEGIRENIYIATKTAAKTPEEFWKQLEISLKKS